MRITTVVALAVSALLLAAPALAEATGIQTDSHQEEVSTAETSQTACESAELCDAPVAEARAEVGGADAEAPNVDRKCLETASKGTDTSDPACEPTGPQVDPGVARVYFKVETEQASAEEDSEEIETQSVAAESSPGEGLSTEAKAALAAGVVGLGATGAVALFGVRRFFDVVLAPLAARLQPNELLEDETRQALYETIRDEPGINLRGLADKLDLAWGTLLHHLNKLEKAHMVTSKRYGKYRRYFLNGTTYSQEEKARLAALSTPSTARVAEYILEHPGATQSEIGEALDVTASTVLWHARRLKDVDLLETQREGRYVKYFPLLRDHEQAQLASAA